MQDINLYIGTSNTVHMLNKNHLQSRHPYFIKVNILMWYVMNNKQTFETVVLPQSLASHVLRSVYDELSHSGTARTYMRLKDYTTWRVTNQLFINV